MSETIDMGSLQLRFLQSEEETAGAPAMFEMTLQPNARMPVPHYHESWDETIYGLAGTSIWHLDGQEITVAPGSSLFIKRGAVHGFSNLTQATATCLCILTPGLLGPSYFKEMATVLGGGAPDPAKMREIMLRYRLIPVPSAETSGSSG